MPDQVRSVFVSATTHDLASYRQEVSHALLTAEILPIVQEYFAPDHRTIPDLLREKIRRCDAVICLVGFVYGAAPPESEGEPRSYTQMEYFLARELGKPTYLFLASPEYVPDQAPSETDDRQAMQLSFRRILETGAQLWTSFTMPAQLRQLVASILRELPKSSPEKLLDLHPAVRPAWFAGRAIELSQLTATVSRTVPSIIAVVGVGGQGKTTLLSHWIELPDRPRFDSVFRVTAYRGGYHFDNFLDDALDFLSDADFHKRDYPEVAVRSRLLLKICQQQRVLFIIDGIERWLAGWNASQCDLERAESAGDRAGHFDGLDDFLREMAGLTSGSHLLLTTRALPRVLDDVACAMVPVDADRHVTTLQGLEDESAIELMRSLEVVGDDEAVRSVVRSYQNHPLALTVLGRLLKKKFGGRLERLDRVSALDPKEHLFQLFNLTRANLPRQAEAERVLQVAGHCLANPSLPVIQAGMGNHDGNKTHIDQLLDLALTLADWNLVQWDGGQEVMVLHPLIREYFAGLAVDSAKIHGRLSDSFARQPIPDRAYTLKDIHTRILAIEHAWRAGDCERCEELIFSNVSSQYQLCEWLAIWGHQSVAVELLGRISNGAPSEFRCALASPKAAMLRHLGRFDEASQCLDEVIEILSTLGRGASLESRLQLASAYLNRGNVRRQQREFLAAISDFDQTCAIAGALEPYFEAAEVLSAKAHGNRGNSLDEMGQMSQALADYALAIQTYERLAASGKDVLRLLTNVSLSRANVLGETQHYVEAIQLYDQIIAAYQELLDRGHDEYRPQWAHAHTMRGFAIADSGRPIEALSDYDVAISELTQLVQSGRRDLEQDLALAYMNRGLAYMDLEQWNYAWTDSTQAIAGFERLHAEGHSHVGGWLSHSLLNRGETLIALGRHDEAMRDRHRGFDGFRRMVGLKTTEGSMIFFRKLLSTAKMLWQTKPSEAAVLLIEAFEFCDRKLKQEPENESFVLEVRRGIARWAGREMDMASAGVDIDRIKCLLPPLAAP